LWEERLAKTWLFSRWVLAIDADRLPGHAFGSVIFPDDLIAHNKHIGTVWRRTSGSDDMSPPGHPDKFTVLEDNPWVRETIHRKPRFRPVIMFRLCLLKCWLNPVTPNSVIGWSWGQE